MSEPQKPMKPFKSDVIITRGGKIKALPDFRFHPKLDLYPRRMADNLMSGERIARVEIREVPK